MGIKSNIVKLKEVVDVITTKVDVSLVTIQDYISTENMLTDFQGIILANNIPNSGKITKFSQGDILFSNIRTYFKKIWLADRPGACSNDVIVFRPKNNIEPEYILSILMDPKFTVHTVLTSKGTKMPRGDKKAILDYEFNLSANEEREFISKINRIIFEKINYNKLINSTLEKISQTLFKSWFVDFDPVIDNALDEVNPIPEALRSRTELRQKVRNSANFKPLPADIRALFPSEFEETELGWVPKGWDIVKTEDIAIKIGMGPFGSNIKVSTFVDSGVPVISGQHLKAILMIDGDNNFITSEHAEKLKNSTVYKKDIIFTHAGNIGQVSIIPDDSEYDNYIISQRQFYLRVNESKSSPYYLIHYFRSEHGQHALLSNASQVGVPSIARPSTHLKNIAFLNPSKPLLEKFDKFCVPLFKQFNHNRKCSISLTALRDTLLPKLISGELSLEDLPDLIKQTEAA
ncbi:restriction endonuclease subunit S [Enterobacter cloacae]|jgi:type I restriction enzyme S subunit|uniref:restriction endonuclease subunit S n=1 Tax=Enterobacter cloacae TaxID=550 RepID=UPI0020033F88|nr:restriction endonuclease subunit S [Enterobacter cloacae]MCK7267286.1 restriction endonuclease subunit S [Enterobacter cloacae]MDR1749875.1 restriction endonuclease subunit S [Enterobacter cloacae]